MAVYDVYAPVSRKNAGGYTPKMGILCVLFLVGGVETGWRWAFT